MDELQLTHTENTWFDHQSMFNDFIINQELDKLHENI